MHLRYWLSILSVVMLVSIQDARKTLAEDFRLVESDCRAIPTPRAKIDQCLALIANKKVSKTYFPPIYHEVSDSFAEIGDYDNAIKYARTEIEVASANLQNTAPNASQLNREGNLKAMSGRYERMGTLLALARLTHPQRDSGAAHESASAERDSYSMAIRFDTTNHAAYMRRAEIRSLLCESAEAKDDLETAVRLARQINDESVLRKYKGAILPNCASAWRAR